MIKKSNTINSGVSKWDQKRRRVNRKRNEKLQKFLQGKSDVSLLVLFPWKTQNSVFVYSYAGDVRGAVEINWACQWRQYDGLCYLLILQDKTSNTSGKTEVRHEKQKSVTNCCGSFAVLDHTLVLLLFELLKILNL